MTIAQPKLDPTLLPAQRDIDISPAPTGGMPVPRRCHVDRFGNVVAVTDANGDLARVYDHWAFGTWGTYGPSGFNQTGTVVQPYYLTTREYDSISVRIEGGSFAAGQILRTGRAQAER